jgi:hypothetical protein
MLSILLLLQLSPVASAIQLPSMPGEGKGTIGIVCMDPNGDPHYWNSRARAARADSNDHRTDFETCLDQVVQTSVLKSAQRDMQDLSCDASPDAGPSESATDLIGGFNTLKKAFENKNQSYYR